MKKKMTKKDQKVLATILLVVGGYLIYKKMTQSKASTTASGSSSGGSVIGGIFGGGSSSGGGKKLPSGVSEYEVKITSGTLNVRPTPATNLAPVDKYEKGRVFYGRPSSAATWVEVVDISGSFPKVIGYVSSQFVLKK
jgi:hypothetical protein